MDFTRSPYTGTSKKLVLAFDIGTTFSGVSYALLDPGTVPKIRSVSRFMGNHAMTNFKIPSTMFYDRDGTFRGVEGTIDDDEVENLHEVRWWKLKVSPGNLPSTPQKHIIPDLPKGKLLQDVFADFIRYLYDSTRCFIHESEPMGKELWDRVESSIDLILSHPNGWEGDQQDFLRKSVVRASVFTTDDALSRVSFVTEGEATFNYCVIATRFHESLQPGHKVLVVDAGGGSIDISSYDVNSTLPLEVEESHVPICSYEGGEIVTARFKDWFKKKFQRSKRLKGEPNATAATKNFDTGTKTTFSDDTKIYRVKVGSPRDNEPGKDVKNGMASVPGDTLKKFFAPSVNAIIRGIRGMTAEVDPSNTTVFLAGGFAASPWIYDHVKQETTTLGLKLLRPDNHTNKAVADGAVSYYLDRFVVGRIARHTYGIPVSIKFDSMDPQHTKRRAALFFSATGSRLKVFSPTIFKGMRTSGAQEFRDEVAVIRKARPLAGENLDFPVIRYTGASSNPQWMDEEIEEYETISHIRVDLGRVPYILAITASGLVSVQEFEVIYIYGDTAQIKAQVAWKDGGKEKRSDVVIMYDNE